MPRIYRTMTPCTDGYPKVDSTARTLGVRVTADVKPDAQGCVRPRGGGMSVAPGLLALGTISWRVPGRLAEYVYGASGKDIDRVFAMGKGTFALSPVAHSLQLAPDSPTHGVVEPDVLMQLQDYKDALAATRLQWVVDELPPKQKQKRKRKRKRKSK